MKPKPQLPPLPRPAPSTESASTSLPRPSSHLRLRRVNGQLSLPPPPFTHETDVRGLEWWLELHVSLAGGQLCVEQLVEADDSISVSPSDRRPQAASGGNAITLALEAIRDALYEMYCDAADPRVQDLVSPNAALGTFVRDVYRIGEEVIATMMATPRDPEALTALAKEIDALPRLDASAWADMLAIDADNPLEPLRNFSPDIMSLDSAMEALARALRAT